MWDQELFSALDAIQLPPAEAVSEDLEGALFKKGVHGAANGILLWLSGPVCQYVQGTFLNGMCLCVCRVGVGTHLQLWSVSSSCRAD